MTTIVIILSIITALGIYNVWFVRPRMATDYRGREAKTLRQELMSIEKYCNTFKTEYQV